ncbi:SAM-dependent methyltransferase [Salinisphaera hydrothermalis]|uniref:Cyclopropane-fatty-acyl-phospholipid synthase n=1 Tax=Salinisphaera hydrothermalis (strain C41B8) TaxID=1304275 RepID=A0A084IRF0_SALHC|nr:cyclopropane-fatty-acyl-phospholipid synthase family protein [Salinisphaera hydrothermalis]KEZ79284.1 Cyclopropane-fatty-acyl-phospholipid synthase [Salinisphaera hydrothermalis C41B8]
MNSTSYHATVNSGCPVGWRERAVVKRLDRLICGRLDVTLPSGSVARFQGEAPGPTATLTIHSPRMVTRLFKAGSVGFAEGYMAGEWDCDDLPGLIYLLHLNTAALEPDFSRLQWVYTLLSAVRHRLRANSRAGSQRNVAYHYDLGNDFYARWLDETWTYSAAVFASADEPLAAAQRRKYDVLLDRIDPAPGEHILEIGCGWGGFARHAATTRDVRVTGITLSKEQLNFARERAEMTGLADRVDFQLCDYRDVSGRYDHVVSIEMYEAVGEAYWPTYFKAIHDALKPGGRAAIQAITIEDARFDYYRRNVDFIQEYIFPGGMLASPAIFIEHAEAAGLAERNRAFYGADYARTLMRWDQAVVAAGAEIRARRGESFYRMWRYYLAYCAAGFTSGNIDLMQIGLQRPQ